MSEINYLDKLTDVVPYGSEEYEAFRDYHGLVVDAFDESPIASMDLSQLTESVNNLDSTDGFSLGPEVVELSAEVYEDLGIIGSERKTLSGTKVYRAPDYHGKGASKSWEELKEEVDNALDHMERMARQESSVKGRQMSFDEIE